MRAPVQKSRPRRTGKQTAPTGDAEQKPTVGRGRPTHVRNRLIVAVAVVAAAIAAAGAPSVLTASGQLKDSQDLVTLAEQTQDALTLAHSLADERDEVVPYIAAGRPESKAPSEEHSARVDRQVEELRTDTDMPQELRDGLDAVATVRRAALTGKSSALEAHQAYSTAITRLHRLAEQLAEQIPPRAGSGAYALTELDSAVQQAAATRGLLLAALNVPTTTQTVIDPITGLPSTVTSSSDADTKRRDALTAAALQARLRSDAALADFRETAPRTARGSYDSTVTGPEVETAEKYLARLTDEPTLSDDDLDTSVKKLRAALTARIDTMRGVESALFDQRTKDLAQLRDDDVTALEIRIAALGVLMLLAIGIATAMARTLTRPLSVLRRGSARLAEAEDPTGQEPVAFTGRNDEFAQVVRSVNALHAHAAALAERIATLEADRKHLVGQRQKMADAREELRTELAESAAHLERLRAGIGGTFVNLALRTLGLVERQLGVIEGLEEREDDPDRLATLFKLDHFATVMRRHSENLLVLAGTEQGRHTAGPVPLVDVVRAAVSEIERYERVRIAALPPHAHIAGFAADDLSHLLAELMENATSFSPPDLPVEVSGWLLENGEVMLSVQDEGIGMTGERLERLNSRLSDFDPEVTYDAEAEDGLGLGLYVVARLAHRHGVRVRLREQKQGGIAAVVVLPDPLLAPATPGAVPASVTGAAYALPGADAEANSNVLHGRTEQDDPLVALAEKAVRHQGSPGGETPGEPTESPAAGDAGGSSRGPAETPAGGSAGQSAQARAGDAVSGGVESPVADGADESSPVPAGNLARQSAQATAEDAQPDGGDDPAETEAEAPAGEAEESAPGHGDESASDLAGHEGGDAPVERPAEVTMELLIPVQPEAADVPAPSPEAARDHGADADRTAVPGARGAETGNTAEAGAGAAAETGTDAVGRPEGESVRPGAGHAGGSDAAGAAAQPFGGGADDAVRPGAGHTAGDEESPSGAASRPVGEAPEDAAYPAASHRDVPGADAGPKSYAGPGLGPEARPGVGAGPETRPGAGTSVGAGVGAGTSVGSEARPGVGAGPEVRPAAGGAPEGDPVADAENTAPLPRRPVAAGGGDTEHARVADGDGDGDGAEEPVTAKGLPKRTPRITAPVAAPRPRTGAVDAEALRRRLGGFRRGADAGRRDVEAELAERTGGHQAPSGPAGTSEETTGGTVEEASS
ncbi:sensor histidine kinase [Streptomyces sp. CB02400]|uniref:sensor histidine kinase n=1 Tax=Streptomyces sp. CB02400 TaxID=1703944 RepID=UPI000ABA00F1|nr:sensor histidine kinase [Streptomyces sp. CB02400]